MSFLKFLFSSSQKNELTFPILLETELKASVLRLKDYWQVGNIIPKGALLPDINNISQKLPYSFITVEEQTYLIDEVPFAKGGGRARYGKFND